MDDQTEATKLDQQTMTVSVWLFGELSLTVSERPVKLEMPEGFSANEVITAMGNKLGPEFLKQVLQSPDEKFSCLRIFVDGLPIEDMDWPLEIESDAPQMEMIMLPAAEGG